jgi:hypothetical protein
MPSTEIPDRLGEAVETVLPDALELSHRTPGHSREFGTHAGGEGGDGMLPVAIRVLAASVVELVQRPELVERAWADLDAQGDPGSRRRRRTG